MVMAHGYLKMQVTSVYIGHDIMTAAVKRSASMQ